MGAKSKYSKAWSKMQCANKHKNGKIRAGKCAELSVFAVRITR